VRQIEGERNFHIFYQLLKGGDDNLLSSLQLSRSIESYLYVSATVDSCNIPNVSDADEWKRTLECLTSITEDIAVQTDIFQLLAGILHLGNINFERVDAEESAGDVTRASNASLQSAAHLLGLDPVDVVTSLTRQNMYVNNNVIVKGQTLEQVTPIYCLHYLVFVSDQLIYVCRLWRNEVRFQKAFTPYCSHGWWIRSTVQLIRLIKLRQVELLLKICATLLTLHNRFCGTARYLWFRKFRKSQQF